MGDNAIPTNGTKMDSTEAKTEGTEAIHEIPAPIFGFNETGTFFLQIHSKEGFLKIMGFLEKAKIWMNVRMDEFEQKKKQESLIKPSSKGQGRFNLFKWPQK